jgi:hypothetical protein
MMRLAEGVEWRSSITIRRTGRTGARHGRRP